MAGLTKTERNRMHKVLERDRIRTQFIRQGLEPPPLLDPDTLGRGPGKGPHPRGAEEGDEATKPTPAAVARATRRAYYARERENIPAVELEEDDRGVLTAEPKKAVGEAITEKKVGGRDVNLRHKVTKEQIMEGAEVDPMEAVKERQRAERDEAQEVREGQREGERDAAQEVRQDERDEERQAKQAEKAQREAEQQAKREQKKERRS